MIARSSRDVDRWSSQQHDVAVPYPDGELNVTVRPAAASSPLCSSTVAVALRPCAAGARAAGPRGRLVAMDIPERTPAVAVGRGPVSPGRTPVPAPAVTAALADVAGLGPWFAVPPLPAGPGAGWVRWDALYAHPGAGDPLSDRIDAVAAALRSGRREAASIAVQGMAARLVSFPLATVALHRVLPDLGALHRRPDADDPWAPGLAVPTTGQRGDGGTARGPARPAGVATPDPVDDPAGAADLLARELAGWHLEPLYAAVRERVAVSERVLRGNVVSAIAGAARVLDPLRRAARPALLGLLAELVGHPALRGPLPDGATGRLLRLDPGDPDTEWSFRRRSCCLYVRVPGGGACGDCVLTGRGRR